LRALAALGLLIALPACGESSAPSPFVEHDGGSSDASDDAFADAPAPDAGTEADPTLGGPCLDDDQCDDGIACTFDECDDGVRRCRATPDDSACNDENFCNGLEVCHPQAGCMPGEPVSCSDGSTCTIDVCDEHTRSCQQRARDADGDGDPVWNCADGGDCNDADPRVSSLAKEVCGNNRDDDCDGTTDETECQSPAHDDCVDPLVVERSGVYSLALAAAKSDFAASCGGSAGLWRDGVVAIAVPDGPAVDVDIVASASFGNLALSAQGLCGDASSETACAASMSLPSGGIVSRLVLRSVPPGNHALLVFSTSDADVVLKVSFRAPEAAPDNETCGSAAELAAGAAVTARLAGTAADLTSACGGTAGDLVYRFELAEPRDVHVYATSSDGLGHPVLSLRADDCSSGEQTCSVGSNAHVFGRAMSAGVHYVAVSATGPSDVSVRLELEPPSVAPPDEICESAPLLVENSTLPLALAGHTDDIELGCLAGAVDAAYALELEERADLLIVSRISQGDTAAVSLARPACTSTDRLACSVSSMSPLRVAAHDVAPGSYRLVAESVQANSMTLTALVRPATAPLVVPFSDRCADALPVPQTGGFFEGNTANAKADYAAGCDLGGQPAGGAPDQMLRLVLSADKRVVLDMRGSAYPTLLVVRRGPDCPGTELTRGCSAGYVQDRSYLDLTLPAGEYFLQVDGYAGGAGRWFLDVHIVDP
jgi:hypothetical protein